MTSIDLTRKSPTYPRIPIGRAIDSVKSVYDAAYDSDIDTETLARLIGFSNPNGASAAAIASLKQFGLMEGRNTSNRVTALARDIVVPMDEAVRSSAIIRAFEHPQLYQAIRSSFGGKFPADSVIRAFLIRNHGFSSAGADSLIRVLRESESFVAPHRAAAHLEPSRLSELSPEISTNETTPTASNNNLAKEQIKSNIFETRINDQFDIVMPLSKIEKAYIKFDGDLTRENIEKLIRYLDLVKDNFD